MQPMFQRNQSRSIFSLSAFVIVTILGCGKGTLEDSVGALSELDGLNVINAAREETPISSPIFSVVPVGQGFNLSWKRFSSYYDYLLVSLAEGVTEWKPQEGINYRNGELPGTAVTVLTVGKTTDYEDRRNVPLKTITTYRLYRYSSSLSYTLVAQREMASLRYRNVRDYGALGDGKTVDTVAVQNLVNVATVEGSTAGIYFPAGTYVLGQINVNAKLGAVIGEPGAILKTKPVAGKWTRVLSVAWNSPSNSNTIRIGGLEFDGNLAEQKWDGTYSLEQQAGIFVSGRVGGLKYGALNALIEDCYFRDNVGNGVVVHWNTNIRLRDIRLSEIFRTGFSAIGTFNKIDIQKYRSWGKMRTGIDFEPEDETREMDIRLVDIDLDRSLQLGVSGRSRVYGRNIRVRNGPFWIFNTQGTILIEDSQFDLPEPFKIRLVGQTTFRNTIFRAKKATPSLAQPSWYYVNSSEAANSNQKLRFENCTFDTAADYDLSRAIVGIDSSNDQFAKNNTLEVVGNTFSSGLDRAISYRGGKGLFKGNKIESAGAYGLLGYGKFAYDVTIDGNQLGKAVTVYNSNWADFPENKVLHLNTSLVESQNKFVSTKGMFAYGPAQYSGHRTIYGSTSPVGRMACLPNDRFSIIGTTAAWVCTRPDFNPLRAVWTPVVADY